MVYPRKYFMYKVLNFFPKLICNVTHHKTYGSGLTAAIEVRKIQIIYFTIPLFYYTVGLLYTVYDVDLPNPGKVPYD